MFKENIESRLFSVDPEKAKNPDKINEQEVLAYVESLLESQTNKIGKGKTAEVHFIDTNSKNCYKIIARSEHFDTVQKSQKGVDSQKFHPLPVEAEFLESLQNIDKEVRVPRPLYTIERYRVDEEELVADQEHLSILAMERLNAVSMRDVIEGREALPPSFHGETFFKKLRNFFERMHEKGIHHRDAHDGNIMIDRETGAPYVIDFGNATYGNGEDIYRDDYPGGRRIVYTKDIDNIDKTEVMLSRRKLLTEKR